jgi:hypothetical protein
MVSIAIYIYLDGSSAHDLFVDITDAPMHGQLLFVP